MKISEIEQELKKVPEEEILPALDVYRDDPRKSVQDLIRREERRYQALQQEKERIGKLWYYENQQKDAVWICGIDEAGRGPLAGPVVAGAVVLPKGCPLLYINDSKKLSAAKREELFPEIMREAVSTGIGVVSPGRIDEINILQATYEAMRQAVSKLSVVPDVLLNDAVRIPGLPMRQVPIIGGDGKSISIGAASILAKVTRDRMMLEYDQIFPEYGFAAHKGYGSPEHIRALHEYGPCPIHRRTFIGNFLAPSAARDIGAATEDSAADYLIEQGMHILARNYRSTFGEIDLIAEEEGTIVFVEVKFRRNENFGAPEEAVDSRKQHRIRITAEQYLKERNLPEDTPCRFDVIGILGREVRHTKDAF